MLNYKLFKDNGYNLKSIKKLNNTFLIESNNNRFIVKKKDNNEDKVYNYLLTRNFNYLPKYHHFNNYNIYEYINNNELSKEEKLSELVNLLAILHIKTTRFQNTQIDDYKIIYEDLYKRINYLLSYYNSLNDYIDNIIYMSPSEYLLIRNISKIYSSLSFASKELEEWYELIKNSKKQRKVLIHNNLDLDHFIYDKNPYLISWQKAKVDLPIYDLIDLYKKYYNDIDFSVLLNIYQKKYPLTKEELKLFFIIISIPDKIELSNNELLNIKKIKKILKRISLSNNLIRQYYQKKKSYSSE